MVRYKPKIKDYKDTIFQVTEFVIIYIHIRFANLPSISFYGANVLRAT